MVWVGLGRRLVVVDGSEAGSFVAAGRGPRDADPADRFRHRPVLANGGQGALGKGLEGN